MDLKIDDLRILCSLLAHEIDFGSFLSDAEHSDALNVLQTSNDVYHSHSLDVNLDLCYSQDFRYDKLSVFIKLLQELEKYRPLPF